MALADIAAFALEEVAFEGRNGNELDLGSHGKDRIPVRPPSPPPPPQHQTPLHIVGCSLVTLWQNLSRRLPHGGVSELFPAVKLGVWQLLLSQPDDVQLFTLGPEGAAEG